MISERINTSRRHYEHSLLRFRTLLISSTEDVHHVLTSAALVETGIVKEVWNGFGEVFTGLVVHAQQSSSTGVDAAGRRFIYLFDDTLTVD